MRPLNEPTAGAPWRLQCRPSKPQAALATRALPAPLAPVPDFTPESWLHGAPSCLTGLQQAMNLRTGEGRSLHWASSSAA